MRKKRDEPDFIGRLRRLRFDRLSRRNIQALRDYGYLVSPLLYDVPEDLLARWAEWADRLHRMSELDEEVRRNIEERAELLDGNVILPGDDTQIVKVRWVQGRGRWKRRIVRRAKSARG